jgi:hypothetical protein
MEVCSGHHVYWFSHYVSKQLNLNLTIAALNHTKNTVSLLLNNLEKSCALDHTRPFKDYSGGGGGNMRR